MVRVYQRYQKIHADSLIFSYTGLISMDLIVHLMKLSDTVLSMHAVKTKQRKSIINVIIEALQNVLYHTDRDVQGVSNANDCFLMIRKDHLDYFIYTGNYIRNEDIPKLENRLSELTPMTVDQINRHYLHTLEKGEISDKGGAGLGLIRILMASKMQTSFHFEPIDEQYSFFTMNITVST